MTDKNWNQVDGDYGDPILWGGKFYNETLDTLIFFDGIDEQGTEPNEDENPNDTVYFVYELDCITTTFSDEDLFENESWILNNRLLETMGLTEEEFKKMSPVERACTCLCYHGYYEFDQYPKQMTKMPFIDYVRNLSTKKDNDHAS